MQRFRSHLLLSRYISVKHILNYPRQRFKSTLQQKSSILPSSSSTNDKIFLTDSFHQFKFNELVYITHQLKNAILTFNDKQNLNGKKVAIICSYNYSYFVSLLAVWLANGVPVPLNKGVNETILDYLVKDSQASLIIKGEDLIESVQDNTQSDLALGKHIIPVLKINEHEYFNGLNYVPDVMYNPETFFNDIGFSKDNHNEGLVIYTSGSSGSQPKGVVQTFSNIFSRVNGLVNAWQLTSNDCFLTALPLNHGHGLIYSLLAPFYAGSQVQLMHKFDPQTIWYKLVDTTNPINIMTSVPSIYVKLLEFHMSNPKFKSTYNRTSLTNIFSNKMRIMASASAPLNTQTFNSWLNLTGVKLIERYGLSETGFCLSNTLKDSHLKKCISGTSGRPYAEYQVRINEIDKNLVPSKNILVISDSDNDKVFASENQIVLGELQVKGPAVFKNYQNNLIKTREAFTEDGWFKTGDIAEFLRESKVYKIIGRSSVDIIQHENCTIKALDIEKVILAYPCIDEAAVMSIEKKGIFAMIVLKPDWKLKFLNENPFNMDDFKRWLRMRLPKHYMPNVIEKSDSLPRNTMGKINKKEIIRANQT